MQTGSGHHPFASGGITYAVRPFPLQKRQRTNVEVCGEVPRILSRLPNLKKYLCSGLGELPDDLLIIILTAAISTASRPSDFINIMLTCRRLCAIATKSTVLKNASHAVLNVRASTWSDGAHRFLKQCADAGNSEACYILGMICFYCQRNRRVGASLLTKAAMQLHPGALYSLAVIHFNGSGGARKDKDLSAGVSLCVRAANLGHVDAMRELGHCWQDGYGTVKNIQEGRRLLVEANAREAAAAAVASSPGGTLTLARQLVASHTKAALCGLRQGGIQLGFFKNISSEAKAAGNEFLSPSSNMIDAQMFKFLGEGNCTLLSEFGCMVPPRMLGTVNRFLVEWFSRNPLAIGFRLCSHKHCGRPETRKHEFRCCSACGFVNYCSRACQALDWKIRHKLDCQPVADLEFEPEEGLEVDQIAFEGAE